jgi:uncharacterized membrane protein (DUF373 family)
MQEMSASPDGPDQLTLTAPSGPATGQAADDQISRQGSRAMAASVWALEHTQDLITVLIGVVLLFLAGALLVSGIVDFANAARTDIAGAAQALLDRALFVLILIEIVHTVVLSLQAHRLIAQPFVIVGLVAVIRRILLLLSSTGKADTAELGLLIAMVAVFVAGLIAVSRFEVRHDEHDQI